MRKTCRVCKVEKPLEEFPLAKGCVDGHRGLCKECKRAQDRHYTNNVRDKAKGKFYTDRWLAAHPEARKKYGKRQWEKIKSDPDLLERERKRLREYNRNRRAKTDVR